LFACHTEDALLLMLQFGLHRQSFNKFARVPRARIFLMTFVAPTKFDDTLDAVEKPGILSDR